MVRKTPLAYQSGYLYKIQLGYMEKPISRIEVALAFIVWYITAYVVLTFPLSYYRHGFIVFGVAILFVAIQWRYFFSLLVYLSLFVPLFPLLGMFFFAVPLIIIPMLANAENFLIRFAKFYEEKKKLRDFDILDEEFLSPYLTET